MGKILSHKLNSANYFITDIKYKYIYSWVIRLLSDNFTSFLPYQAFSLAIFSLTQSAVCSLTIFLVSSVENSAANQSQDPTTPVVNPIQPILNAYFMANLLLAMSPSQHNTQHATNTLKFPSYHSYYLTFSILFYSNPFDATPDTTNHCKIQAQEHNTTQESLSNLVDHLLKCRYVPITCH